MNDETGRPRSGETTEEGTPTPEEFCAGLLPHHAQMIRNSAISEDVAMARGYRSVQTKIELQKVGFSNSQRIVPTLLIPIWGAHGEIALYHHRPDKPRMDGKRGRLMKYEFPFGARMAIDVHPHLTGKVRDPTVPLFITEGAKKADAAISAGLCCIGVIGTWNWRGTNEYGGKTALPDWDCIALKDRDDHGRQVYICYDSDVMLKREVYLALCRISEFLKLRGARVAYIYLPSAEDGSKQGLDDYLATGKTKDDLLALAIYQLRQPPHPETSEEDEAVCPYEATASGIVWNKPTQSGPVPTLLTNFVPLITTEVIEDDGVVTTKVFEIEATRGGRMTCFSVPAPAFPSMGWVMPQMGAAAIVYPGYTLKDHARAAIQMLSGEPQVRNVYTHLGWRQLEDGRFVYLHSGGAIGVGAAKVEVRLPNALEHYQLPEPPIGDALQEAVHATLHLCELGPKAVCIPLFATIWRAAIGTIDFSLHLVGPTGSFKTEVAALVVQHWGAGMNSRNLPGAWSSTANSLEALAFAAKDAILIVDDFAPCGSQADVQRLHAAADRLLRAQGNNTGRQRMRPDGGLRPTKPPRGTILSTGEDIPSGQSLRARILTLELAHADIPDDRLTLCQRDAAAGLYAQAMSAFLAWLAPRYEEERTKMLTQLPQLRELAASSALHRRTPEIIAQLAYGLRLFLIFAQEVGVLTLDEVREWSQRGWQALGAAAKTQSAHQAAGDPAGRFLELLHAAFAGGKAHLTRHDGFAPLSPEIWGWRKREASSEPMSEVSLVPMGDRVGWIDGDNVYLIPEAVYNVVRRMGESGGEGLNLTPRTLWKRLKERSLLASTEEKRGTLTIRRQLEGASRNVLHFLAARLMSQEPDIPDIPDIPTAS